MRALRKDGLHRICLVSRQQIPSEKTASLSQLSQRGNQGSQMHNALSARKRACQNAENSLAPGRRTSIGNALERYRTSAAIQRGCRIIAIPGDAEVALAFRERERQAFELEFKLELGGREQRTRRRLARVYRCRQSS